MEGREGGGGGADGREEGLWAGGRECGREDERAGRRMDGWMDEMRWDGWEFKQLQSRDVVRHTQS